MEIYNTLTRQKEKFIPRQAGKVSIYVCGPTAYNYIHLGNARPLVFFDTVRRYFQQKGYEVRYIQNFTDIDDKIIKRALEEKDDPLRLAQRYIDEYFKDADALNVKRADNHPRVSEHMEDIIRLIEILIEKGFAYAVEGDVYFDVSSFPEYGKLSHRSSDEMLAGARVEVDPRKKNPMDFALWKSAKQGEPFWESPWGQGRPGWHMECSAMSLKYLGPGFDIHGGGMDLIFPHHENEIAQSEAATGKPFARYWVHNGFITVNQEKMSKSLGNYFLIREILSKFPPLAVRFFLLSTHYRSPLDFDDENVAAATRGRERLKNSIELLNEALNHHRHEEIREEDEKFLVRLESCRSRFMEAMDDDFNTALAIGVFFELAREVNIHLQEHGRHYYPACLCGARRQVLEKAMEAYKYFNAALGLFKTDAGGRMVFDDQPDAQGDLVHSLIELLIQVRAEARSKKDWAAADRIRDGLKELGIMIEDTPQGVRWKKLS
jgi:cysteinyl-tRNA synthetase